MKKIIFFSLLTSFMLFQIINAASPPKLFVSLVTDKMVYKKSDIIAAALTVLNQNSRSCKFDFTSSQIYDFFLYNGDKLVWKWSGDKMFTMALTSLTLEPKKPITYVITFNQKLSSGQPLEPGRYKLVGAFCIREKEYLSEPVEIEIR